MSAISSLGDKETSFDSHELYIGQATIQYLLCCILILMQFGNRNDFTSKLDIIKVALSNNFSVKIVINSTCTFNYYPLNLFETQNTLLVTLLYVLKGNKCWNTSY